MSKIQAYYFEEDYAYQAGYYENEPDYHECEHKWVGSGNPNGMIWCKICNENYNKTKHGKVELEDEK